MTFFPLFTTTCFFLFPSIRPTQLYPEDQTARAHTTPVSLSRPVATGLARPLFHSFSCCCLQEPLCFPSTSHPTPSPSCQSCDTFANLPLTSFWTCLYAPECNFLVPSMLEWSGCLSSQQNPYFGGYHFGREVTASRCPLTFHHLSRCSADRAVSISPNHHRLCHLTRSDLTLLSLTSSLAWPRGALPPPATSSCPWPTPAAQFWVLHLSF